MDFGRSHQLDSLKVARSQLEVAVLTTRDHQGSLVAVQCLKGRAETLGLVVGELETLDHGQLAVSQLGRQRRTQRPQQLLARKAIFVRTRLWPMNRSAVPPQW